jgi:hypothetical protein
MGIESDTYAQIIAVFRSCGFDAAIIEIGTAERILRVTYGARWVDLGDERRAGGDLPDRAEQVNEWLALGESREGEMWSYGVADECLVSDEVPAEAQPGFLAPILVQRISEFLTQGWPISKNHRAPEAVAAKAMRHEESFRDL